MNWKKTAFHLFFFLWICAVFLVFLFRNDFVNPLFIFHQPFHYPEKIAWDNSGGLFISDSMGKRILHTDIQGHLLQIYHLPKNRFNRGMASGTNGMLYIVNGNKTENLSILEWNSRKGKTRIIFPAKDSAPFQQFQILENTIQYKDGALIFLQKERSDSVGLYSLSGNTAEKIAGLPDLRPDNIRALAGYKPGYLVYTSLDGKAYSVNENHLSTEITNPAPLFAWACGLDLSSNILVCDTLNQSIRSYSPAGSVREIKWKGPAMVREITVNGEGQVACIDEQKTEILIFNSAGNMVTHFYDLKTPFFIFFPALLLWILMVFVISGSLIFLFLFIKVKQNLLIKLSLAGILASGALIGSLFLILASGYNLEWQNEQKKQIESLADWASQQIKGSDIPGLSLGMIPRNLIQNQLRQLFPSQSILSDISAVVYRETNGIFYVAADSDNLFPVGYPIDVQLNVHQSVFQTGKSSSVLAQDVSGTWFLGIAPVFDSENHITGIIELSRKMVKPSLFLFESKVLFLLLWFFAAFILFSIMIIQRKKYHLNLKHWIENLEKFRDKDFDIKIDADEGDFPPDLSKIFNLTVTSMKEFTQRMKNLVQERTEALFKVNEELRHRNQMMKTELITAQKVQDAIIPRVFPETDMLRMSGIYMPMEALGGDYYDVFKINDSRIAVVMADVSGHGVSSAMITAMARVSFSNNSKEGFLPGTILKMVNRELCRVIADMENYLSAFYCVIDMKNGILEYSSAGHNDVYLLRRSGELVIMTAKVPFIGKYENLNFPTEKIPLEEGDKIILFTDGFTEARNESGEFFGDERFRSLIIQNHRLNAQEMVHAVIQEIEVFKDRAIASDDKAILIIDVLAKTGVIQSHAEVKKTSGGDPIGNLFNQMNEQPNMQYQKALELYKSGKLEEANITLEHINYHPDQKEEVFRLLLLRGLVYYKLEKWNEAYAVWNSALKIHPENIDIQKNLVIVKKKLNN